MKRPILVASPCEEQIAANELRIGNWLKIDGNFEQVHRIGRNYETGYTVNDALLNAFEPILIDSDILQKSGFKPDNIPTTQPWVLNDVVIFMKSIHELVEAPYASFGWRYPVCIKYLHQLQNLFFALSGTELEFKL